MQGWTALYEAALWGRHHIVPILLHARADVNIRDWHVRGMLMCLQRVRVDPRVPQGKTALDLAINIGRKEVLAALVAGEEVTGPE
jgi:hypothetical protein